MDVRGRCDIGDKSFICCPARINTAFFHFQNDYEIQKQLEKCDNDEYEEIIKRFLKKLKLTSALDNYDFTKLFIASQMEEYEDKINGIKELENELVEFEEKKQTILIRATEYLSEVCEYKINGVYNEDFKNWANKMCWCFEKMSKKMFGENENKRLQLLLDLDVEKNILNKPLVNQYMSQRYFNRFQFRYGRRITLAYQSGTYRIIKTTKSYIEVCDDDCDNYKTKITKPRDVRCFIF